MILGHLLFLIHFNDQCTVGKHIFPIFFVDDTNILSNRKEIEILGAKQKIKCKIAHWWWADWSNNVLNRHISHIIFIFAVLPVKQDLVDPLRFKIYSLEKSHHYMFIGKFFSKSSTVLCTFIVDLYNERSWTCVHYTTRGVGGWKHDNEPPSANYHVSLRQSMSRVLRFWTHVHTFSFGMDVNASQTHNFKTIYSSLSYGWPYACITGWCLLWCFILNCPHSPPAPAVTAISPRKNSNHVQLIWWKVMKGNIMRSSDYVQMAPYQTQNAFLLHVCLIHSTSWCQGHARTDIQRLIGHTVSNKASGT